MNCSIIEFISELEDIFVEIELLNITYDYYRSKLFITDKAIYNVAFKQTDIKEFKSDLKLIGDNLYNFEKKKSGLEIINLRTSETIFKDITVEDITDNRIIAVVDITPDFEKQHLVIYDLNFNYIFEIMCENNSYYIKNNVLVRSYTEYDDSGYENTFVDAYDINDGNFICIFENADMVYDIHIVDDMIIIWNEGGWIVFDKAGKELNWFNNEEFDIEISNNKIFTTDDDLCEIDIYGNKLIQYNAKFGRELYNYNFCVLIQYIEYEIGQSVIYATILKNDKNIILHGRHILCNNINHIWMLEKDVIICYDVDLQIVNTLNVTTSFIIEY